MTFPSYDNQRNLTSVDGPLFGTGDTTSHLYDAAHRLTEVADNAGNRITYTLDPMGNRTKEEVFDTGSTLRRTLSRTYDALNRLRLEIHP